MSLFSKILKRPVKRWEWAVIALILLAPPIYRLIFILTDQGE